MANLEHSYHLYNFPNYTFQMTLKRFYCNGDPNELGSIYFWEQAIIDLYNQIPFPDLWNGFNLEIWDMKHKDLISSQNITLLDYDLHKEGNQTAVGLYFSGDSKRIALGVWLDAKYENNLMPIEWSRDCFSHEFGHLYADISGVFESTSGIKGVLTDYFKTNRPFQTDDVCEDFAETYRAILGASGLRGSFSDNKKFYPKEELKCYMKTAYWLSKSLENKSVSGFSFNPTYVQWYENVRNWFWVERVYYALTTNWELFKWNGSSWKIV